MSLQLLQTKINGLRKTIYRMIVLQGASKALALLFMLASLSFILDYFLDLPYVGRVIISSLAIGVFGYVVMRECIRPVQTHVTDDDLILAMERAHPELKERLISAFQFGRLLQDPKFLESRELSLQVVEQAQQLLPALNPGAILNVKKTLGMVCIPLVLWLFLSSGWALFPRFSYLTDIWGKRNLLFQDVPWPRRTYLFLLQEQFPINPGQKIAVKVNSAEGNHALALWYRNAKARYSVWHQVEMTRQDGSFGSTIGPFQENTYLYLDSGERLSSLYEIVPEEKNENVKNNITLNFPDYHIVKARGQDLRLKVATRGTHPNSAWVYYQIPEGEWHYAPLSDQGHGVFKYVFQTLTQNISFYLEGGDDTDQLPKYQVTVLTPPSAEAVRVWYRYPGYTKLAATPWDSPQPNGNIKAVKGTQAFLRITPNVPIRQGKLVFIEKEGPAASLPLASGPFYPEMRGKQDELYSKLIVEENGRYQVVLTAQNGLIDANPAIFTIRFTPDLTPTIQVVYPKQQRLDMTASGTVPLHFKVSDDYGLAKIAVRAQSNRAETWDTIFQLGTQEGTKELENKYPLDLSKIQATVAAAPGTPPEKRSLQKGDVVVVKLYAEDNNNVSGPGVKESQIVTVEILEKDELSRLLTERLQEVKKQLRRASEQQREQRTVVDDLCGLTNQFEPGDLVRILQLHFSQKGMSRDIAGLKEEVDEILRSSDNNALWDNYTKQRVDKVGTILGNISQEQASGEFQGKSVLVEKWLMEAYQIARQNQEQGKKLLQNASQEQGGVLADLESAIQLLGEWEDFQEVVRDVEMLLEQQKKVEVKVKKLVDERK